MMNKELVVATSGAPPLGGGPGTTVGGARRTIKAAALLPNASSSPANVHKMPAAYAGDNNVQAKLVHNLQQQVFFLELELKYLREQRGAASSGKLLSSHLQSHSDFKSHEQARDTLGIGAGTCRCTTAEAALADFFCLCCYAGP
eukprot:scaffold168504_cov33-Tisochrysis_lutea.AAC.1